MRGAGRLGQDMLMFIRFIKAVLLFLTLAFSQQIYAYPEFIGYSYSSCLTCHVNGQGSGPLNDYGRALWSAEIAARSLYPASMSDEDIAAQSGFAGSAEIPWWVRPHFKYRGINVIRNLTGSQQTTKFYQMQADMGVTLQADPVGKYVGVITYANIPAPEDYGAGKTGFNRILAREYYLRMQLTKTYWLYAGLMDKVFGIRNIDHTSFQRSFQGFGVRNNSADGVAQSQGVILHKVESTWEMAGNYFVGNPHDNEQFKQKGFSMMGEYETGENRRLGGSYLDAKSKILQKNLVAVHYRHGLSKGSSFLFEYGLINDKAAGTGVMTKGSYNLLETLIQISRGYHFKANIERYNREFKPSEPDVWKWSLGVLAFPMPRVELRAELINGRQFSSQRAADDTWAAQGQIHVSL